MADGKPTYRDEIAAEIIARIEAGTAPWQKPWQAGTLGQSPFNPVSGNPYHGINQVWLDMQGRSDPRWMTYKQAAANDAQVRKGEKAATVEYWKFTETVPLTDPDGNPVLGADGKARTREVRLDRPRVFLAKVFNAEQIDGLAPYVPPPAPALPALIEAAEAMIASSGVPVFHDQVDRAFYRPSTDQIHLPPLASFHNTPSYYDTVLHELGHATGHHSRLARDFGPFGSERYAREELRAEIASYMLARDLGISFDPSNHASYVESWLKVLREDKNEIFRAARDAETIKTWVMEPERRPELERGGQGRVQAAVENQIEQPEVAMPEPTKTRHFIAVPFAEKDQAKAAGAKWDRQEKSWYVPEGLNPEPFAKWAAGAAPAVKEAPLSPIDEFAQVLKANGLVVEGAPVMDGKWHRVAVTDDKGQEKSGSYRGFLDGRPSGQITNYRGGDSIKWVATGTALTDEERARIQAEAANVREARRQEQHELAERAAKTAYGVWTNLPGPATPDNCPYLAAKGVGGHGVKVNEAGQMVVPARDAAGRLWNIQTVTPDGKLYLKDSRKAGTMHVLEVTGKGTLDSLAPLKHGALVIAEGYATAATIHEATGHAVIVAFDSGNLKAVAEAVHAKYPDRPILIAADNDHARTGGNIGMIKAEEAAKAVGGTFVAPQFTAEEKGLKLTDFNDLAKSRGNQWVRRCIETALSRVRDHGFDRGVA